MALYQIVRILPGNGFVVDSGQDVGHTHAFLVKVDDGSLRLFIECHAAVHWKCAGVCERMIVVMQGLLDEPQAHLQLECGDEGAIGHLRRRLAPF